ncbi:MAG: type II secretion system protein GspG [Planctomycetota bacterium]
MSYRKKPKRRARFGFTLMEILVVLLIIGLLSAAVVVGVRGARENGRKTTARMEINNIVNGLEMYNSATARYPTQNEGLEVLLVTVGDFEGGILKKKGELNDPWGNPYLYVVLNGSDEPFEVICTGPDGREGTSDDISNLGEDE